MITRDLHTHTYYCDGKNAPEEMVLSAIDKGLESIGFSGHCYTFFDKGYAMSKKNTKKYIEEISRLKEKYRGRIEILCGIEQDYYADLPDFDYDYIIGSVHYVKSGRRYIPVDETKELLLKDVRKYYDGDFYAFCNDYYRNVGEVVDRTGCDIIGHFDLVSKFNEDSSLFDASDERYVSAWKKAADRLLDTGKIFEINTGGISRGYRTSPYPEKRIYDYLKEKGGRFILSSDSHSVDTIAFEFDKYECMI